MNFQDNKSPQEKIQNKTKQKPTNPILVDYNENDLEELTMNLEV